MRLYTVEAFDIPEAWFKCLALVLDEGREYTVEKGSYEGTKRKELDYITIHIQNPGMRPLIPVIPPGMPVEPPTNLSYVYDYFENYLMSPVVAENETYTYGSRIHVSLFEVIEMLKKSPDTNQAIIQVGSPTDIFLEDPPCLRHIDCRLQGGRLHFIIYFRSWDLWGGFPTNLAGLQLLKEFMAEEIGCADGEMICSSKGLHLYEYAWPVAKIRTYKYN